MNVRLSISYRRDVILSAGCSIDDRDSGYVKVTPNLRGATLVDFFSVKKMKVRQLRYHFPKKVSKNIKTRASY